jgi:hypothetical protein
MFWRLKVAILLIVIMILRSTVNREYMMNNSNLISRQIK